MSTLSVKTITDVSSFDFANTQFAGAYNASNAAFNSANLSYNTQNVVFAVANAAYGASNSNFTVTNTVYSVANSGYASINSNWTVTNVVYGVANAAFDSANNVGPQLAPAYNTANAAFASANTKLANATGTLAGALTTTGTITSNGYVYITAIDGVQEGGEIQLSGAGNYAAWSLDSWQNNHRVFVRTGSTLANINYFHATGGSVRMGVNKADPLYTLDVNGDISGGFPTLFQSRVIVTTSDNRSLGASASWTDHISVGFTTTRAGPVFINVVFAMSYESDAVHGESRVELRGTATRTSDAFSVAQQSDQNRSRGSHSFTYFFGNVLEGSYTAYLQVRNSNAGTWILNNYIGYDTMTVHYI